MTTCIRSLTVFLVSLLYLQVMVPSAHAQLANTPWPMFHHDLQHTGRSPFVGPQTNNIKWQYKGVNWIKSQATVGPNEDEVYISVGINPLCVLDGDTGVELRCLGVRGGLSCSSTPAMATNGIVYIGDRDNTYKAINPNGTLKWSFKVPYDGDVLSSPAIASDNTTYMASNGIGAGPVYRMDPNGVPKPGWPFIPVQGIRNSSPAISADGATVYIGTLPGFLIALNTDGTERWRVKVGTQLRDASPSIGADGTIYIGSSAGLSAVSPTGIHLWTLPTAGKVDTTPAIAADGTLYVSSYKNRRRTVYAIDPAGPTAIPFLTGPGGGVAGFSQTPSPVVDAIGTVYAAIGKIVYAFEPDGTVLWQAQLGGEVISLSLGNGTLYVSARDRMLHAFGS